MEQIALPTDQVPEVQVGILFLRLSHLSRACVLNVSTFPLVLPSPPLSSQGGENDDILLSVSFASFCSDPAFSLLNINVVSCLSVPYFLLYVVLPLVISNCTDEF